MSTTQSAPGTEGTPPPSPGWEPPRLSESRLHRMIAPTVVIGGISLATIALHFRDPHDDGSWGYCPSAAMGIWCPGCGGLRAVNDLTNFRVLDAASSNLLFIVMVPLIVFLLGRWAVDRWQGRSRIPSSRLVWGFAVTYGVVAVAFAVLRNIPAGSWLAP